MLEFNRNKDEGNKVKIETRRLTMVPLVGKWFAISGVVFHLGLNVMDLYIDIDPEAIG